MRFLVALLPTLALVAPILVSSAPTNATGHCRVRHHHKNNGTASSTTLFALPSTTSAMAITAESSSALPGDGVVAIASGNSQRTRTNTHTVIIPVSTAAPTSALIPPSSAQSSPTGTLSVPAPVTTATGLITAGSANANLLIQLHNDYRAQYGAGPLTWNNDLAAFAQNWTSGCVTEHSHGPYGENLAWSTGRGTYNITGGFDSWTSEAGDYDYSNPGKVYNHWTQVVWKQTTELGCGISVCTGNTIMACEYYVGGNLYWSGEDDPGRFFRVNVGEHI